MKKYTYLIYTGIIVILLSSYLPCIPNSWYSQYLILLFFIYLLPILILWRFNKFLSIFIGVCLYSTFFVSKISPRAVILLIQFEALSLISYGISKLKKEYRKIIVHAFIITFIFQCFLLTLQFFNKDFLFNSLLNPSKDVTVGFMGSLGQMGILQSILSPFVMPYGILLSALTVSLSHSFFAFIAFMLSSLVLVYFNYKNLFILFLILTLIGGFFYYIRIDNPSWFQFALRINVWKHSIKSVLKGKIETTRGMFKCNPLFGYGFGNFLTIFPYVPEQGGFNAADEKFNHAHNDYIEHGMFEMGIIGIIVLLSLVLTIIVGFIRSKKDPELVVYFSSIFAYMICAGGYFVSQMAVPGFYLAVIYGMYEGVRGELNG